MLRNRLIIYAFLMLLALFSCIKPFEPELGKDVTEKYVVSGLVTDREGYQQVTISRTSPVDDPKFKPVKGAQVTILDLDGDVFEGEEVGDGNYRVWIDGVHLFHGNAFKTRIILPSDEVLESDYEVLITSPEIDSIYYIREDVETTDPNNPRKGIQFYVDVDGEGTDCRYYRWEILETWEYQVPYPRQWYYDGSINRIDPPDYSRKTCWYTTSVKDIYDLSTQNLTVNSYKKFPIHFVDNSTSRLSVLYSMVVSQYSMTEAAYDFWDQVRINSGGQGGLYSQQPLAIKGNVFNVNDPDKLVLGFFGVSSVKSIRMFIQNVDDLEVDPYVFCVGPVPLGPAGWSDFYPDEYPVFFIYVGGSPNTLSEGCVDCLVHGGTNVKPDFWPAQ